MKDAGYAAIAAYEETFWWHRIRRDLVVGLLRQAGWQTGGHAVDIGCASGGTFNLYRELGVGVAFGLDRSEGALASARSRHPGALLACVDAARPLPLADASVDLVTIFGVLYHAWIPDEQPVFHEVSRILRPGGLLCITEPAFPSLTRASDRVVMTRRRYLPHELPNMARAAGLRVLRSGHFASWAFLPAWILARLERAGIVRGESGDTLPSDLRLPPRFVNAALYAVSRLELAATFGGLSLPFGVTCFGVFRKP